MTADFITYERAGDLYLARGSVQVAQDGRVLTADWAAFSNETRKGMAVGNVVAREGGDIIHARAMRFQLDAQVGLLLGGDITSDTREFQLRGAEIERKGEDRYRLVDARFTTCQCPEREKDPWAVRSEDLEVEIGGYATARNSTIDILGVPVLWLPWLGYPVKSERETGLLFPQIRTSSRTGLDVGLPFFWAAAKPLNVTIAPHYLTKRGFKPELTLEYVVGEHSWGELYGTFVWNDDEVKRNDPVDPLDSPSTPFSNDRWAIDLVHDQQDLPAGWRAKLNATLLSDNLFPFDFPEYANIRNNRRVAWRNLSVVAKGAPPDGGSFTPPGYMEFPFLAVGAADRDRFMGLEVISSLPRQAVVLLEFPSWMKAHVKIPIVDIAPNRDVIIGRLSPTSSVLGGLLFRQNIQIPLRLLIHLPDNAGKDDYRVAVRQLHNNAEVGRVTWIIAEQSPNELAS